MPTTVYFATNRKTTNAQDWDHGYTSDMVSPMQPDLLTYGQATVNGIDLSKDQAGEVTSLSHVTQMDFAAPLKARMSAPGTNMLVFIHGFDNSFSDAVTRAAFKQGVAGRIRTTWHGYHRRCVQLAVPGQGPGVSAGSRL